MSTLNLVVITALVVGLPLGLRSGIFPNKRLFRLSLFFGAIALVMGMVVGQGWTAQELGLRTDNLSTAFLPYLSFTVVGVAAVFAYAKILGRKPDPSWKQDPHFRFLFIPLSLGQQLLFSGFLLPNLQAIFPSQVAIVALYAALFSFLHIIYPHPKVSLPLGFVAGMAFCIMYLYYPNLVLIGISHAILNFVTVLFGFMSYSHGAEKKPVLV